MENKNMKKVFYYLRCLTPQGDVHPYACVCVAQSDEGVIARGISVCSPSDHFSKEIGRAKALGYAIRALNGKNVQVVKRSNIAGCIIDNILGAPIFPNVSTIRGKKNGKYIQSSTLLNPNDTAVGAASLTFIPLTTFEKKLLENG